MEKALHIFTLKDRNQFSSIEKWISDHQGKILFSNSTQNIFICEMPPTEVEFADEVLVTQNPHKDLMPAFFNLIETTPLERQLLLKSASLISLMDFYQNLLSHHKWSACEIVFHNAHYYGLLFDGEEKFVVPHNVEFSLFPSTQDIKYS